MSLNSYVTLGRSGLRVSPFCLGAMTFGDDAGCGSSVEGSEAILSRWPGCKVPGVTSTVIDARTLSHLDGNPKALDLKLNAKLSPNFAHAGATVNGLPSAPRWCASNAL